MLNETLTFTGAQQLISSEFPISGPVKGRLTALHLVLTGCALTGCILQVRPVPGADFEDFVGGGSSVNWSSTDSPRLWDVSSSLTGVGVVGSGGTAWAACELAGFSAARLKLTSSGAGSALVRIEQN